MKFQIWFALASMVHAIAAPPARITPPDWAEAKQPQVAVSPSGSIHVTFGKGNVIYHSSSMDRGVTFTVPVEVGELPGLALGMRRGPRIAATEKVLVISAISSGDGNLHAWTSLDAGATWKESAKINDEPRSAREGLHAMTGDGKDNVFAAWLDLRNGGTELWGATSQDGGATWGANALVYKSPDGNICECCHPSVAMDAQGRVAVMWRNWLGGSRDFYTAMSTDRGKTFSAAQKLGTGTWKLNACPMDGGGIAFSRDGKLLATWRREKAVFSTEGTNPEQCLDSSAVQPIVIAGKNTYYLWESGGGLMMKKDGISPVRFATKASSVAAAMIPTGGAAVVWQSEEDGKPAILAQMID